MGTGTDIKTKRLIFILVFVLVAILITIIVLVIQKNNNTNLVDNETENNTNISSETSQIEGNDNENKIYDETASDNNAESISDEFTYEENARLKKVNDIYKYFVLRQCMIEFYESDNVQDALSLIDEQAREDLNITQNNVSGLYGIMKSLEFCIDEVYEQTVDSSKDVYLVYYRQGENSKSTNLEMLVKVDREKSIFSIYPYEYLRLTDNISMKENDKIYVDSKIENGSSNVYNPEYINIDDKAYIKALFERYKYDLTYDLESLYRNIDEGYRNTRFKSFDEFNQYINQNKEELLNDELTKYKVEEYSKNKQYTAICENNKRYIFYSSNIMEYILLLDNYTTATQEYSKIYDSSFPTVKAKYCIDRVRRAINDKNYEFVYQKLDEEQKDNEFANYSDFETYIKARFYDQNTFEYEDYMIFALDTYQYKVKVTDSNGNTSAFRRFDMKVTLKADGDFTINITQ